MEDGIARGFHFDFLRDNFHGFASRLLMLGAEAMLARRESPLDGIPWLTLRADQLDHDERQARIAMIDAALAFDNRG